LSWERVLGISFSPGGYSGLEGFLREREREEEEAAEEEEEGEDQKGSGEVVGWMPLGSM